MCISTVASVDSTVGQFVFGRYALTHPQLQRDNWSKQTRGESTQSPPPVRPGYPLSLQTLRYETEV